MAAAGCSSAAACRQIAAYNSQYLDLNHLDLDVSPHSFLSDADFLLASTTSSSASSSSTPALFPDLSAAFPPVDPRAPQLFYDPLCVPSMFPGDPVTSSNFDQIGNLTTTVGYPTTSAQTDNIDWTALSCLSGLSNGLSEHPANSLGSQSQRFTPSVDSPDPPFDHHQQTLTTPSTSHTTTATSTIHPSINSTSMRATTLPTPSPASASRESSPKENPSRITKRQLNTMAARRYRQRRLDRMAQLEEELEAVKLERDELKMRVSKLEGETEALRSMVKEKK
ncbi:hypothetical protein BDV06DRAFT_217520 [Aspergillus oleicola]